VDGLRFRDDRGKVRVVTWASLEQAKQRPVNAGGGMVNHEVEWSADGEPVLTLQFDRADDAGAAVKIVREIRRALGFR
jgi:hypothetical protein